MPLIKEVKIPATKTQSRVQAAAWTLIYAGLLTLITGYTMWQSQSATSWLTGEVLMVSGSLVTALGAVLVYIRSLMKNAVAPKKEIQDESDVLGEEYRRQRLSQFPLSILFDDLSSGFLFSIGQNQSTLHSDSKTFR